MFEDIKEYLNKMPPNALSALPPEELEKRIFQARESLSAYHPREIAPRIVILQGIYEIEGAAQQYASLKRQGISSFSTKRGSISFEGGASTAQASGVIAPQVIGAIGEPPSRVGRLR
ncbi:hypothetical protein ACT7CW_06555 [Bacillus pacificus]